jgi:SAM-dependent methyltransferase
MNEPEARNGGSERRRSGRLARRRGSVDATRADISALESRIGELEYTAAELRAAIKQMGGFLLPPAHLQSRVAAYADPFFIEHGEAILGYLQDALGAVGKDLTSFPSVLDFGCGCARVLRAYHYRAAPSQQLFGTDLDVEAIEWCQANYSKMAEFSVNPDAPPMAFPDETFDLVYSVSVFTHLPEDMQLAWLRELQRVTKAGGYLLLTTFNEQAFTEGRAAASREEARESGFFYDDQGLTTEGLPDFYRQSYHTPEYIRSRWSEYFDVLAIRELAVDDLQDIVVCRRR